MPEEMRRRVMERNGNIINKAECLIIVNQETRGQLDNKRLAVEKLTGILRDATVPEKERNMREAGYVSEGGKQRRREDKKRRSGKKENRGSFD